MGSHKAFFKIIFLMLLLTSCLKQTESITPIAEPKTLAELQREAVVNMAGTGALTANSKSDITLSNDPKIFFLNLRYNIKDMDVFKAANVPNQFEQLAHSFLGSIAQIVLSANGPRQVDINNISFTVPNINIDRSMVSSIKIKRVFLQYASGVDSASDYAADFSFIDSLDLSQVVTIPKVGTVNTLLLSYQITRNNCMYKCLDFDIEIDNVLDLMVPNSTIKLKPALTIAQLPHVTDLKLDGYIQLQIGLRLPF